VISQYVRSLHWVKSNSVEGKGIVVSDKTQISYPEVTGYFIPTLLNWGERGLANQYANWLVSIQSPSGGWYDAHDTSLYTFDTGQILKGLFALSEQNLSLKYSIVKGCDWIINQIDSSGYIGTPDTSLWQLPGGKTIPNAIQLYCLEPIKQAGTKWKINSYTAVVEKALQYYLKKEKLTNFNTLSHFHAYVAESLVDLGEMGKARQLMNEIEILQKTNGFIPAYSDVKWTCSTGLFQFAVIWYKLGELEKANRTFSYACSLQNKSGGFYGSYGRSSNYFPKDEISWAVKYFLDALWWKIKTDFNNSTEIFPDTISSKDGRYIKVLKEICRCNAKNIIDIGCGKGRYLKRLSVDYGPCQFTGLDISEEMLRHLPDTVNIIIGSLLNIPSNDQQYDFGFSIEALEHGLNIPLAIREMARVIKRGGTLLIIDKNRERLGKIKTSEWEQWFSDKEITRLLEYEGFRVSVKRNISYDENDGSDGLFVCWTAEKL